METLKFFEETFQIEKKFRRIPMKCLQAALQIKKKIVIEILKNFVLLIYY